MQPDLTHLSGEEPVNLWVVDVVEPHVQVNDDLLSEVNWISGEVSKELLNSLGTKFDLLFCLSTSRYFDCAVERYSEINRLLIPGALMVIDFYELPIVRQLVTQAMRQWILGTWSYDQSRVLKVLEEIAIISKSLADELRGIDIDLDTKVSNLMINSGKGDLQKILYETFFPFWYRAGVPISEVVTQLVRLFLCRSNDNSIDKIERYVDDHDIIMDRIMSITNDTHVLIGRTLFK